MISGGVAGCVAKTFTAPLSRLTILEQTSTLLIAETGSRLGQGQALERVGSSTIWSNLRDIVHREGPAGLWRGNLLTCLHRFPYTGINFCIVESCYRFYPDAFKRNTASSLFPGALAGGVGVLVCYPLEVARTRVMIHRGSIEGRSSLAEVFRGIRFEGVASTYRGIDMALAVTVPSLAISFSVYRGLLDSMSDYPPLYASFAAGGISGLVGSTLTFPLDVLRRRLQVMGMCQGIETRSWWQEARHIWRNEGHLGFWRGLSPEMVKVFPTVGVTFVTFEWLQAQVRPR